MTKSPMLKSAPGITHIFGLHLDLIAPTEISLTFSLPLSLSLASMWINFGRWYLPFVLDALTLFVPGCSVWYSMDKSFYHPISSYGSGVPHIQVYNVRWALSKEHDRISYGSIGSMHCHYAYCLDFMFQSRTCSHSLSLSFSPSLFRSWNPSLAAKCTAFRLFQPNRVSQPTYPKIKVFNTLWFYHWQVNWAECAA